MLARMQEDSDIFIINHDGILGYTAELKAMGFQKIVVDESTILKNYRGAGTKSGSASVSPKYRRRLAGSVIKAGSITRPSAAS